MGDEAALREQLAKLQAEMEAAGMGQPPGGGSSGGAGSSGSGDKAG